MKNFAELERELKSGPNGQKLAALADSDEGRRLSAMLDPSEVERAAKQGNTQALKSILAQVLSTPDGQALAEKLSQTMKNG